MVIAVLQGSVPSERTGDRAAKWVITQLHARGHDAVLVDAATFELPLLDKMWKEIKHETQAAYGDLRSKLGFLLDA